MALRQPQAEAHRGGKTCTDHIVDWTDKNILGNHLLLSASSHSFIAAINPSECDTDTEQTTPPPSDLRNGQTRERH